MLSQKKTTFDFGLPSLGAVLKTLCVSHRWSYDIHAHSALWAIRRITESSNLLRTLRHCVSYVLLRRVLGSHSCSYTYDSPCNDRVMRMLPYGFTNRSVSDHHDTCPLWGKPGRFACKPDGWKGAWSGRACEHPALSLTQWLLLNNNRVNKG